MKTILTASVLAFSATVAQADSFAPWNDRAMVPQTAVTSDTHVPPTGFAPWRERAQIIDMPDDMPQVTDIYGSTFRPWS